MIILLIEKAFEKMVQTYILKCLTFIRFYLCPFGFVTNNFILFLLKNRNEIDADTLVLVDRDDKTIENLLTNFIQIWFCQLVLWFMQVNLLFFPVTMGGEISFLQLCQLIFTGLGIVIPFVFLDLKKSDEKYFIVTKS
jgi:hypothetical protein